MVALDLCKCKSIPNYMHGKADGQGSGYACHIECECGMRTVKLDEYSGTARDIQEKVACIWNGTIYKKESVT